ncbi:sulfur carrier protein ThiS [Aeoliella mucimassa]|uniref:Sulfur carrier protein ThiS n=1 Tax=Aeoliella mucimassa TaxID=2527972 RepID=A0A518AJQ2_9BACT|nr:sulfur carrier protein ThiS [Aeoliella mucimassa]QDU54959.1 Sulfur carrier protein ThiS [Aeoliella mucimassa]
MQLQVNGEPRVVSKLPTIAELLAELEVNAKHVAVEVNCELVPRTEHAAHELTDGDQVEIVTLVGGG